MTAEFNLPLRRLALVFGSVLLSLQAQAQNITEYRTPTAGSQPLEIAPGPGGMWFTERGANRIGWITPDGTISEFAAGRLPSGIVGGPDGNLWFTSLGRVSRITTSGVVTEFGSVWLPPSITVGPDGRLWFADSDIEAVGYVGQVTLAGQATESFLGRGNWDASTITAGPDGRLWLTVFGDYDEARIVAVSTSGAISTFVLPGVHGVWGITAGPDGNLWFTETKANKVGRITTAGVVTEFAVSGNPRGITAGVDGNLWFAENTGNRIGRITTQGEVTEFPIPTPDARPWGIGVGVDGSIWFTENGASQIGRISFGAAEATPLSLAGDRFRVSASWQTATASGPGHPVALTRDAGYFWFFDPSSVEVVVKVIDGCSLNNREWVFAGGLTNVSVVLTVTDTQSGLSKAYFNPLGAAFRPIQDTDAFSICP